MTNDSRAVAWAHDTLRRLRRVAGKGAYPTFILIGSPQGGTSWLYRNLSMHPDIHMPFKELRFWSTRPDAPMFRYAMLFDRDSFIRGDMTPHYVLLRPDVIRRLARRLPDLRLLVTLRDPVERTWSATRRKILTRGVAATPEAVMELIARPGRDFPGLRDGDFSRYSDNLPSWIHAFGREALLTIPFSQIGMDPTGVMARVLDHIGADPSSYPWDRLVRGPINVNVGADIPTDLRDFLAARYAGEAAAVRRLLDVDCPW